MEEYWNYIKWLGKSLYEKEIQLLGNVKVNCIFHDKIDYKMITDNLIIIMDCNNIQETIYKIYNYKNKIEVNFKIVDISVFKANDTINFSENCFISFYCIDKKVYEENSKKYSEVFCQNLKTVQLLNKYISEIFRQDSEKRVRINNTLQNSNNTSINTIYIKILENLSSKNKKDLEYLECNIANLRTENTQLMENYKVIEKNLLNNIKVDYVDRILQIKSGRLIRGYNKKAIILKKINEERLLNKIFSKNYSSIVVLDCDNYELCNKCINIFEKINSKIIIISKDKKLYSGKTVIYSLDQVLNLIKECKLLYINNKNIKVSNKDVTNINISQYDDITEEYIINKIINTEEGLFAFSNVDHINSVKVLTGTFFNFNGGDYCAGGAERYLIDLYNVCKKLGMKLRVYQKANFDFFRYYNDIEVIGISDNKIRYNFEYEQNIEILKRYNLIANNNTKLNIYSSFMECYGKAMTPSIGISHGVAWDHKENSYNKDYFRNKDWIIDAAIACDKLVSVDNNTANWFQTIDYKFGNSIEVIPNYVDIDEFKSKKIYKRKLKYVILYPRRLCEARGMYLLLDITDKLLNEHKNIEIHFVGKGSQRDTEEIQQKVNKWGEERIKMYSCSPENMHDVYKNADISVIPTLYSEGTSLSCLEAMSTGNAVIATRVGGLTDLIINNYNGKLIEPNKESLYEAIIDFISNRKLMKKCRKNAREIAKEFNKDIWIEKWKKIIKNNSKEIDNQENVYYNIIKIYISNKNLQDIRFKKIVLEKLTGNNLVYVVNNSVNEKNSYGRLQYIKEGEYLYRTPDLVLVDSEYENKDNIKGNYIEI